MRSLGQVLCRLALMRSIQTARDVRSLLWTICRALQIPNSEGFLLSRKATQALPSIAALGREKLA